MILAHRSVILLLLFLFLFSPTHSYQLWDWKQRQKRRLERQSKRLALSGEPIANEVITDENEENEISDDVPTLNVSSKDSPYALIDQFFPERELNHQFMNKYLAKQYNQTRGYKDWNLGQLEPDEVWLSDGDLLVLRGGATPNRKSFDDPLEPLDDYVAPYREPKLPPPDFVPSDTGVGVALPPENEESTTRRSKNPFKSFLFDEEQFIQEMENFHSERRAELFGSEPHPLTKVATPLPFRFSTTASPLPLIERSSPTPATPPVTTPSSGYFVSTATPSSFSFLYNTDQEKDFFRERTPPPVARSTTTPPTTTVATPPPPPPPTTPRPPIIYTTTAEPPPVVRELPSRGRDPKSFYVSDYGQKLNEIDIDNKVAEERHDHFFVPRWPPLGTPFRSNPPQIRSRNSLFNHPGPTLASTVISSLKPRPPRFSGHRKFHPQFNANPYARRRLPVEPQQPPPQSSLRRSSNDHRYVSFYRGQIGGQSWGYSYRL